MELFTTAAIMNSIFSWLLSHGVRVVIIIAGIFIVRYFARAVIDRFIRKVIVQGRGSKEAEKKREDTIIQVLGGVTEAIIWTVGVLMLLSEFGVAVGPIIAAAGIVGVAVGFGGQYLIRDLFSGFFMLMENQYRVGDIVCFGTTCGVVETITLRMTTLRDLDGVVHHVPHGEVTSVSNLSKQFSRVNLNIGVGYQSDLERVISVLNDVGARLAEEEGWRDMIVKPPQFLRVDDFADSAIVVKVVGDTKPGKQWDVAGELRKRIKIAFDKEGIEIPFPQRVVHMVGK